MLIVPLLDVVNQTINVTLGGQACTIVVRQTTNNGVFLTLYVAGVLVLGNTICENLNLIVKNLYLGFLGDLAFFDTQGSNDPSSPGLGSRYILCYFSAADLNGVDQ